MMLYTILSYQHIALVQTDVINLELCIVGLGVFYDKYVKSY